MKLIVIFLVLVDAVHLTSIKSHLLKLAGRLNDRHDQASVVTNFRSCKFAFNSTNFSCERNGIKFTPTEIVSIGVKCKPNSCTKRPKNYIYCHKPWTSHPWKRNRALRALNTTGHLPCERQQRADNGLWKTVVGSENSIFRKSFRLPTTPKPRGYRKINDLIIDNHWYSKRLDPRSVSDISIQL